MSDLHWGILGPARLPSDRRSNTLGLGTVIRMFNERAVPGVGGLFFGKQALLAILGIEVAQDARAKGARASNIAVANCLEAMGCWFAFRESDWTIDRRLRGSQKLRIRTHEDFTFARASSPNFYVTQPIRMSTVQVLPVLGFVTANSSRFNQYESTPVGRDFVHEAVAEFRPGGSALCEYLSRWVRNKTSAIPKESVPLRDALSPLMPLALPARDILLHKLLDSSSDDDGSRQRRRNIWNWLGTLSAHVRTGADWKARPPEIDRDHWLDMHAGARFQGLRAAALAVLQSIENLLARNGRRKIALQDSALNSLSLEPLAKAARIYLDLDYECPEGAQFARECLAVNPADVARSLAGRDGTGIALAGEFLACGPAFRGSLQAANSGDDHATGSAQPDSLPRSISPRVRNMLYLYNEYATQTDLASEAGNGSK